MVVPNVAINRVPGDISMVTRPERSKAKSLQSSNVIFFRMLILAYRLIVIVIYKSTMQIVVTMIRM